MSEPTPAAAGSTATLELTELDEVTDRLWSALLHNDRLNVTVYVTAVLRRILLCTTARAEHLMITAQTHGRATVYTGSQDKAAEIVAQLRSAGLHASMVREGSPS